MYINEAAQQFIDSHKPEKIDVDRIKQNYTRVEGYLASLAQRSEDKEGYYVEISGVDSITGQPIRVQWLSLIHILLCLPIQMCRSCSSLFHSI